MKESKGIYVTKHDIRAGQLNRNYHLYTSNITRDYRYISTREAGVQYNYRKDNVTCTCRNITGLRRHHEVRYFSGIPRQIYTYHGSRSFTDIGVGDVKAFQRKKVKRIYLPETDDRGVGSSDLISFINRRTRYYKGSYYEHKKTSSKCVGGPLEANADFLSEKLSPIVTTKSGTTSPTIPLDEQKKNVEIGSNTCEKSFVTTSTQVNDDLHKGSKDTKVVEVTVEQIQQVPKQVSRKSKDLVTTTEGQRQGKRISKRAQEAERVFSSDSLVEHVHNLEHPSEDSRIPTFIDPMENKLEREYRKMFISKSKDSKEQKSSEEKPDGSDNMKSTSVLRRRFEALRRGLAKKEDYKKNAMLALNDSSNVSSPSHKDVSIASDPPSLEGRSYSNTKIYSPFPSIDHGTDRCSIRNPYHESDKFSTRSPYQETDKSSIISPYRKSVSGKRDWSRTEDEGIEYQGVKGMFKLWGKKFNLDEEECSPGPSVANSKKSKDCKIPTSESESKKEGKKFFFFKKKSKDKTKPPFKQKKGVTAGRCEVGDGLMIKIGAAVNSPPEEKKHDKKERRVVEKISEPYVEMLRKAWLQQFLARTIESRNSVKVRWNNNAYATSSSTVFEMMENVYKDTGVVFRSRSEVTTGDSSYYKSFTKQRVNFVQDIEAWMIPKLIPDVLTPIPVKIRSDEKGDKKDNIEVTISDNKWYIDKSKAFAHKIEVVLHSNNIVKPCKKQESEYLRIDIPKGFFSDSSSDSGGQMQTSNEEVYKIVEYELPDSHCLLRKDKTFDVEDHLAKDIKVTVSVKDSGDMESKILETVIKRPPVHRDVVIQGSNVLIPKSCNVIGVGIITQKDITRIRKPILKIQDDYSDEDSEKTTHQYNKSRLAETYLQDYYRHWAPLGLDFFSWCVSDSHVKCCSENSRTTINQQGDGTKSCPNIYEDYQASAVYSSCGSSCCSKCAPWPKTEEEQPQEKDSKMSKFFNKFRPNKAAKSEQVEQTPDKRVLPKDSVEVHKRRRFVNVCSNRAKWSSCDPGPYSVPSNASRGEQDTLGDCTKNPQKACYKPAPLKKNACNKHVSLPGCEFTLPNDPDPTANSLTCPPAGILSFKGATKCTVIAKDSASCQKHATTIPRATCEIPPPTMPCKEEPPPCPPEPACPSTPLCPSPFSSNTRLSLVIATSSQSMNRSPKCPSPPPCMLPTPGCIPKFSPRKPEPPPCCASKRTTSENSSQRMSPMRKKLSPVCKKISSMCKKSSSPNKSSPTCTSPSPNCLKPPPPCVKPSPPCVKPSPPCVKPSPPCVKHSPPCVKPIPTCKKPIPTCEKPSPPCRKPSPPCVKPSPTCVKPSPPCVKPIPTCKKPSPPCRKPSPPCVKPSPPCVKPSPPCAKPIPPCELPKQSKKECKSASPSANCKNAPPSKSPSPSPSPPCSPRMISPSPSQLGSPRRSPQRSPQRRHQKRHLNRCPSPVRRKPPPCPKTPSPTPSCPSLPPCPPSPPPCAPRPCPPATPPCPPKPCPPATPPCPPKPCPPATPPCPPKPCPPSPPYKLPCPPNPCTPPPCPGKVTCPKPKLPQPKRCDTHPCKPERPRKDPPCNDCKDCPSQEFPWPMKNQVSNQPSLASCVDEDPGCKKNCSFKPETPKVIPCKKRCVSPPKKSGIFLRKNPSKKICSKDCESWKVPPKCPQRSMSDDSYMLNMKKCTPSTEEIREGLHIKGKDKYGRTVFERYDYQNQRRNSLLTDMYKNNAHGHTVSTSIVQNMSLEEEISTQDLQDTKSDESVTNLIEINFKLKVKQGDKTTEFNIGNDGAVEKTDKADMKNEIGQTSQEVFLLKDEAEQCTEEPNEKNDINIKIVIKNYKSKKKDDKKLGVEDFAQSISEKFQTVSTGYSDVLQEHELESTSKGENEDLEGEENAKEVYSVHRTTTDLASSNEVSKTQITSNEAVSGNEYNDSEPVDLITSAIEPSTNKLEEIPNNKDSDAEGIHTYFEDKNYSEKGASYSMTDTEYPEVHEHLSNTKEVRTNEANTDIIPKSLSKVEKKRLLKKVFEKACKSRKSKNKEKMKQLRNMLKVILTSDSSDHEDNVAFASNELVKEMTYASLQPKYFRDTDSMNNYYSSVISSSKDIKQTYPTENVSQCSVFDSDVSSDGHKEHQGCLCSTLAARLNVSRTERGGCCCKKAIQKTDEETCCDLRTEEDFFLLNYKTVEYMDVETQNSKFLTNSTNFSFHSKAVSGSIRNGVEIPKIIEVAEKANEVGNDRKTRVKRTFSPHYTHIKPCQMKVLNRNTTLGISDEDKVYLLNTEPTNISISQGTKREKSKEKVKSRKNKSRFDTPADILQCYETKKAVLEIYAEKTISDEEERVVAKLPRFVYDKESQIERRYEDYAENSYRSVKRNIVMMSINR